MEFPQEEETLALNEEGALSCSGSEAENDDCDGGGGAGCHTDDGRM